MFVICVSGPDVFGMYCFTNPIIEFGGCKSVGLCLALFGKGHLLLFKLAVFCQPLVEWLHMNGFRWKMSKTLLLLPVAIRTITYFLITNPV